MGLIDQIRDVPEVAVRLYLGASVRADSGMLVISLDGKETRVNSEVYDHALGVVRGLKVRERTVQYASDILELRHDAEDIFMGRLVGVEGLPSVLFVPAGDMASAFYRARIPAEILADKGLAIANHADRVDMSKVIRYDILWVQVVAAPMLTAICRAAQKAGVKIVYDIDDKFDAIPPENPASEIYIKEKLGDVRDMIELADMVTVSTNDLAEHVRPMTKAEVRILPNMILAAAWPRRKPVDKEIFRILWAGSPTHKRDLEIITPAILKILGDHKGKVRFTCFGEQLPESLVPVKQYIDLLKFVQFEDYADALADAAADIAIAPLEDNPFNASKSAIKVLEYGACGYPVLLSPVGEYKDVAAAGAPVALVTDDGWLGALENAITEKEKILPEIGKGLQKWVQNHRCIYNTMARQWADAAKDLLAVKNSEVTA